MGVQARRRAISMKIHTLVFPPKSPHTNVMEAEHEQVLVRRKKLAELVRLGCAPYPNDFRPRDLAADLLARHGETPAADLDATPVTVALAGRLMAIRDFGKAAFAHLQDRAAAPGPRAARGRRRRRVGAVSPARPRRPGRRRGPALPHQDQRADGRASSACATSPKRCSRSPRSGTACRTSSGAIASATSISSPTPRRARSSGSAPSCCRACAASSRRAASSRSRRR